MFVLLHKATVHNYFIACTKMNIAWYIESDIHCKKDIPKGNQKCL